MPMAEMGAMLAPSLRPWGLAEFLFALTMWAVMMIGMMTPSAAPMILIYARVARQAALQRHPFAPAGWFAAGYLLCWTGFALIATSAQWALERAALLAPMSGAGGDVLGGLVLLAAGIYQLTPLKTACLSQCQSPPFFIHRHGGFRADAPGSLRLGLAHGAYCVGCCWAADGAAVRRRRHERAVDRRAHGTGAAGKIVAARTDLAGPRRVRPERGRRVAARRFGINSSLWMKKRARSRSAAVKAGQRRLGQCMGMQVETDERRGRGLIDRELVDVDGKNGE
jgi:hypothetical protein